jgi:hypothetical protein
MREGIAWVDLLVVFEMVKEMTMAEEEEEEEDSGRGCFRSVASQ